MSWNYRVMRFTEKGETWLELREVYYDDAGKLRGHTVDPASPIGEDIDELRRVIARMMASTDLPVLTEADFEPEKP